jgi:alpha-glucosidase
MRLFAYLLPPLAMLAVVGMIAITQLETDDTSDGSHGVTVVAGGTRGPDDPSASRAAATVCEGAFQRPAANAPRSFPAFYTQRRDVEGITVLAGPDVDSKAISAAQTTIHRMFANNTLIDPLIDAGAYVVIYAKNQSVLDLPEFSCLASRFRPGFFDHVCGVADHADYPVATVSELDLEEDPSGPCQGLNVLYHEIGHLVQNYAIGPADYYDVKLDYRDALDAGKYQKQYAATNANEYFAEGAQSYFSSSTPDGKHDRKWLKGYDPSLYDLLARNFGE